MSPFRLLVLGAAGGGVAALTRIVAELSPEFSLPVVAVVHLADTNFHGLQKTLRHNSSLPMKVAAPGEGPLPGHLYVAFPGVHLVFAKAGTFAAQDGPKVHLARPAADRLFESAALVFGPAVLAVVLSGGGRDGADGARIVRSHGGTVVVQSPETAALQGMPAAAMGSAHYVTPLAGIAARLERLARGEA